MVAPPSDVHPDAAGGGPVLAVLLDRRVGRPSSRLSRHPQRVDDDVNGDVGEPAAATCVLHQGHRRVDVRVPRLRRRGPVGVCRRQHTAETEHGEGDQSTGCQGPHHL